MERRVHAVWLTWLSPRVAICLLLGVGLLVPTLLLTAQAEDGPAAQAAGRLVVASALTAESASGSAAGADAGATSARADVLASAAVIAAAADHVLDSSFAARNRSLRTRDQGRADERPARDGSRRDPAMSRALALLDKVPLIDGHNDLPWKLRELADGQVDAVELAESSAALGLHTDLNRLRRGRVGAQFWSAFVPSDLPPQDAVLQTLDQVDLVLRLVQRYPGVLELARSASDIERIHGQGRIASLIGVEGGHSLGSGHLTMLRHLQRLGVRYLTLTHNESLAWADAATGQIRCGGLSPDGVAIVREMNKLGMLVDLSHAAVSTMHDVLDVCGAPVIFSHSAARALVDHPRNVPDDVLARIWENGGLVMVTFVAPFVSNESLAWWRQHEGMEFDYGARDAADQGAVHAALAAWTEQHPRPRATIEQVADHIVHVARIAGVEHVGIGSDFDGMSEGPVGLEDVSMLPNLVAELLRRGFSEQEVAGIIGRNFLRVMRDAERVSEGLTPRPPRPQKKAPTHQYPAGNELNIDEIEELDPFTEKPFALLLPRTGATG